MTGGQTEEGTGGGRLRTARAPAHHRRGIGRLVGAGRPPVVRAIRFRPNASDPVDEDDAFVDGRPTT